MRRGRRRFKKKKKKKKNTGAQLKRVKVLAEEGRKVDCWEGGGGKERGLPTSFKRGKGRQVAIFKEEDQGNPVAFSTRALLTPVRGRRERIGNQTFQKKTLSCMLGGGGRGGGGRGGRTEVPR